MMDLNFSVVGVGYSAGGLNSVEEFIANIPDNSGAAFVIVHHMPVNYKSQLTTILAKYTRMPIHSIRDSMFIQPNQVYVLDENQYVKIWDNHLYFISRPQEKEINVAIDTFFLSLAEERKDKAIGIIFSGSGSDGAKGGHAIHEAGGHLLIQDPSSATFQFMPINAIRADKPDSVASPIQLAKDLLDIIAAYQNK